ncbi:tRNA (adenosine(37)-N6)-dimethylallyltransferase MiaA [Fictibacillus sp. KIGAM418]|uniref:tRNA dimethylallyltransferase n=1 Tax=Fictibacillus marinisediminis TaxID=2878389 RepID=A0A9X2BCP7_9BACL|nr:tRNA (adenosine(37)-N6)-dimethylallyltransferase MiaA [Fictibacillus marinisediminis]MCK6257094.1 tRNA (adenosine(37)-N6)-dimethylallyltransferase MiaA [Fictibacillus marinisediminis]
MKERLFVIVGPTAVGKTKTGIELAKAFDGEIISGDSMQIYRSMDIGTAKISKEEMEGIPHHLIDIKDPCDSFSAAEFQELARTSISDINKRGKVPIIVGGTGLYIRSVTHQYEFSSAPGDESYRQELEELAREKGEVHVHALLEKNDPKSAGKIHPNNIRRVIRALEIYHSTGKTMSDTLAEQQTHEESPYELVLIGLSMERELLYERINQRVDEMVASGLVEEAHRLYSEGVHDCQSVQAIGYKEIYEYLEGRLTLDEAVELLKRNSRRYAKRQYTWFRNQMDIEWFDMSSLNFYDNFKEIRLFVEGKLKNLSNDYSNG